MYRIQIFNANDKLNHTITCEGWDAISARDSFRKAIRENPGRWIELQYRGTVGHPWQILWDSRWS